MEKRQREADSRESLLAPARSDLLSFTEWTNPRYIGGWFSKQVAAELDAFLAAVMRKESPRLMLFAPPRHGKSELVSRRFPPYALGRAPDLSIIATSYAADLASRLNRDVQRVIDTPEYSELFPDTNLYGKNVRSTGGGSWMRNSDIFEVVNHRGGYRSAGVGGGITGMGADIGIIDDPFKDAQEANSLVTRERVWEWYTSTFYTRIEAGGGILIILTRWHHDDLAGRLLKQQANGDGDNWRVANFPAIAEEDRRDVGDPRDIGEALHPERFSVSRLDRIRAAVGDYVWSSLYQQRPTPRDGALFKPQHIEVVDAIPGTVVKRVRAWDLAATRVTKGGDPDYTVGVKMARCERGLFWIEDVQRFRDGPEGVRAALIATASQDGFATNVRGPQDPGQAGKAQSADFTRALAGYNVEFLPVTGDKVTRASPFAAQVNAGNVRMVRAPWNETFLAELRSFPAGSHDDQVDAATDAFNTLAANTGAEGLLEFYRQEVERGQMRLSGVSNPAKMVRMTPPPYMQSASGMSGKTYTLEPDGSMLIDLEDVLPMKRAGFIEVEVEA